MSLTYTDIFCGAGGSSIGLTEAGLELKLAANHWVRAIETHSTNFPAADHLCADVNNYDMRRLPRTDVLWASPICTEISPAGGRKRRAAAPDLFDHGPIAQAGFERTRATFWDVIRATEVHRYRAVLVENVVDVLAWELFDVWCAGMRTLGYNLQFVSVSAAHVGDDRNPHAPQWRDRLYIVCTRTGIPLPDVTRRPLAWCPECDEDVHATQEWKDPRGRQVGKYRQQYVYRCPNDRCRHAIVEPYVLPALAAIDCSDLGTRIGDRQRPLATKTRARIRAGIEQFARPITLEAAGNTFERRPGVRTWPVDAPLTTVTGSATKAVACPPLAVPSGGTWNETATSAVGEPLRTRMANEKGYEGIVCPPFVDVARTNNRPRPVGEPLAPLTTGSNHGLVHPPFITELRGGSSDVRPLDEPLATVVAGDGRSAGHHALTVPPGTFFTKHYTPRGRDGQMAKDVRTDPLGAILAHGGRHSLVVPYYRTGRAKPTTAPLDTVTTKDRFALVVTDDDIDECLFRMLQPREHLRAQRFPDSYIVTGNKGEQTMQAGNAVSANVAHWLGRAIADVLGGAA